MKAIAENRKARHNYFIEEEFEAGVALLGSEVKSLRAGGANISDAHVSEEGGELFLVNFHIAPLKHAVENHEAKRKRKLLLHSREIEKIIGAVQKKGMTSVALRVYFNGRGFVKVKLGVAKGKKLHDKRETVKNRDWDRQKARAIREN